MSRTLLLQAVLLLFPALPIPAPSEACIDFGQFAHQVSYQRLPESARRAAIEGNLLFVATPTQFYVLDIADGYAPQIIGSLELVLEPTAISVSADHVYIAGGPSGIVVLDVSVPASPHRVAQLDVGFAVEDVVVNGDYAYIAAGEGGMFIVDVHEPSEPVAVGHLNAIDSTLHIDVQGPRVYVVDDGGLIAVSIEHPTRPRIVGSAHWNAYPVDVATAGNRVIAGDQWGLRVMDAASIENPPLRIRSFRIVGGAQRVDAVGEKLYALNGNQFKSTLSIATVGLSEDQGISGQVTVVGSKNDFCVNEAYACVMGGWYGFAVLDVARPVTPPILGHATGSALTITVRGKYAYLGFPYWAYFRIVDISDPYHPSPRGVVYGTGWGAAIALLDDYAIVAGRMTGMHVIDVSNPNNPFLVGSYSLAGEPTDVAVYGENGVFATGSVRVVDFSDPSNPQLIGSVVPPGGAIAVEHRSRRSSVVPWE